LATFTGRTGAMSRRIARLFPPNRALFLYASQEVQAMREGRHSVSEIRINQEIYRSIPKWNPRIDWHEIWTDLPAPVVAQRALFLCMTTPGQRSVTRALLNLAHGAGRRLKLPRGK